MHPQSDTANVLSGFTKESQLTVLFAYKHIYAYWGYNIESGRIYTYHALAELLKKKRSDKQFSVIFKPCEETHQKISQDMLDMIAISNTENYALIEITKAEAQYFIWLITSKQFSLSPPSSKFNKQSTFTSVAHNYLLLQFV